VEHLFVATNHNYILFFTEKGKVYWLRAFEIPEGAKTSKGRAIQNLINIDPDDKVRAYINVTSLSDSDYIQSNFIILCTRHGTIKKTSLEAYSRPRQNGIIAVNIKDDDMLLEARMTNGNSVVLMGLRSGRAIRFNEQRVRPMGRTATGVRGVTLAGSDDEVIGMICVDGNESNILVVSENGYGKRSLLESYRETMNVTDKTGALIAICDVTDQEDLMIINRSGIIIRTPVSDLRVMGRATQGVRLINIREGDSIAAITKVDGYEPEDEITDDQDVSPVQDDQLVDGTVIDS